MKKVMAFAAVFLVVVAGVSWAQAAMPPSPDAARAWFNLNAVLITLVFGFVWKFVPALKAWANWLIPWLSFAGFALASVVGAQATSTPIGDVAVAVTGAAPHQPLSVTLSHAATNVGSAVLAFETIARPILKLLGIKKP